MARLHNLASRLRQLDKERALPALHALPQEGIDVAQFDLVVSPVSNKAEFNEFIDCAYRMNASDPNWVPPLRGEVVELLTPGKNPFHEHADMQLFIARRGGRVTGRISAHIDHLALTQPPEQGMGPGTGNWGLFEAEDEDTGRALIAAAEDWLRQQGMTRVLAPISLSVWEEPGLLVKGHDHPPTVMMGHNRAIYQQWIERAGYDFAKSLRTFELEVGGGFPPIVQRIVQSGERNGRIRIRQVNMADFAGEAQIIVHILNDAWSRNWGFVPFTASEVAYVARKLKPLIIGELNMIAEFEGKPVAFMLSLPNANEPIKAIGGKLFPFGWLKLLLWLRNPRSRKMRVPLMGVLREHQNSRLASQLAFMMIEYIRRNAVGHYGAQRAEIGWILDDNQGMNAIADAIGSTINRDYWLYHKPL